MREFDYSCKKRNRFVVIALVAVGIGLVYLLFFSGTIRTWIEVNGQLVRKEKELLVMEQTMRRRDQVQSLCKKFEQRILASGTNAEELGFLLKEIETLTRSRNVQVRSIRPMPGELVGNYKKFTVSFQVETRVHNLLELLYSIDTSPKILTVEFLKIQALRKSAGMVSADMVVSRTSAGGS